MKKLMFVLFFIMLPTLVIADAQKTKVAHDFLANLPEYSCFQQYYYVIPLLPWELGGKKTDGPHMLIKKNEQGFLFAQRVPDCQKRTSCGYWIRSLTYENNFLSDNLEQIACPEGLTKSFVEQLIQKEYKNDINLGGK
jgi:hypothetical protein